MPGTILAIGGALFDFSEFVLSLAEHPRPRVCFLATASGDDPSYLLAFYERFGDLECEPSHLRLFGMPEDPARHIAGQEIILVGGGNTANMLAVWRVHGVNHALKDAWEGGAVLAGASAGANCWFEDSITDSFGPQLESLNDGLAILPGSFCPHYDAEEQRRPTYTQLVRDGRLPSGIACDDRAAAIYQGSRLVEVVTVSDNANGYRVTTEGEEVIPARRIA